MDKKKRRANDRGNNDVNSSSQGKHLHLSMMTDSIQNYTFSVNFSTGNGVLTIVIAVALSGFASLINQTSTGNICPMLVYLLKRLLFLF